MSVKMKSFFVHFSGGKLQLVEVDPQSKHNMPGCWSGLIDHPQDPERKIRIQAPIMLCAGNSQKAFELRARMIQSDIEGKTELIAEQIQEVETLKLNLFSCRAKGVYL